MTYKPLASIPTEHLEELYAVYSMLASTLPLALAYLEESPVRILSQMEFWEAQRRLAPYADLDLEPYDFEESGRNELEDHAALLCEELVRRRTEATKHDE